MGCRVLECRAIGAHDGAIVMNARGDESAGSPEPDRCVSVYELDDDDRVDGADTAFRKVVPVGIRW